MKNLFRLFALLFVATLTFVSCSKDDDPTDNEIFFDEYKGTTSYTSTDKTVALGDGTVRVGKLGDTYDFYFGRSIPDLKGIKMEKGQGTDLIFNDGAVGVIRITESILSITYAKDGKTWFADCERD